MNTSKSMLSAAAAALVMVGLSGSARADGVALRTGQLGKSDLAALKAQIKKTRVSNPAVYQKVALAPKLAMELDEQRRGRAANLLPPLRALGKDALFPMLEMLAVDAQPRGKMSATAWTALRTGLIAAVGVLRDARSKPVLEAILRHETDFEVLRAATAALGRLGDDASAQKLAKLALRPGPKQAAVVAGLGDCRRLIAAEALAKLVGSGDAAQELAVLRSLGNVGNAWAWQTPDVAQSKEGPKVRAIAARALMKAFVKNTGESRRMAEDGLLIVDDPSTPALIAQYKQGASPELAAALDALAVRVANNPAR